MKKFKRTYKIRPWHRYENVIIGIYEDVACGGYTFRWSGKMVTNLAINLYPVETRRIDRRRESNPERRLLSRISDQGSTIR